MQIIRSIIFMILFCVLFPWSYGRIFLKKKDIDGVGIIFVVGWIVEWALFEILAIPFIFLEKSLSMLSVLYIAVLGSGMMLCILDFFWGKDKKKKARKQIEWKKEYSVWKAVAILCVLFQMIMSVFLTHMDADDTFYLGTSITSVQTNTMYRYDPYTGEALSGFPINYVFSPLSIFWAMMAKITGIHPLIITHSIIPFIFICLSYVVAFYILKEMEWKKKESPYIGVIILSILNIYGNTSVYTTSSFLLFRIWQGKALLCNIMLPFIVFVFIMIQKHKRSRKWWMLLFVTEFAACMVSSMGVVLSPILTMLCTIYCVFKLKSGKYLWNGMICCLPVVFIGLAYMLSKF